jgi:hypothetical protein
MLLELSETFSLSTACKHLERAQRLLTLLGQQLCRGAHIPHQQQAPKSLVALEPDALHSAGLAWSALE